jgi:flagellar biosynthesis repressor protein FlbT
LPLKLSLRPSERFVVNGAVLQNGDRRCVLMLQNHASILREKDIMQPEEAKSPARRIYFPIMLRYLGEGDAQALHQEARLRIQEFAEAIRQPEPSQECAEMAHDLEAGQFYRALTRCRKLMAYEESVLRGAYVDQSLSAGRHAG